jgi:aminoglycoside 2'-N-acetyltransferase I
LPDGMTNAVTVAVLDAADLDEVSRREIVELCELAYGEDFSRLFVDFQGSTHVLGQDGDGRVVSHAEWVTRWLQPAALPLLRTAYIEAVATHPSHQRKGLATMLLQRIAHELTADPAWDLAALSPSYGPFYARLGWEAWKGPLAIRHEGRMEPTPADEEVMIFRLPRTPPTLDVTSLLTAEWRAGEPW